MNAAPALAWRASRRSIGNGECVEAASAAAVILVRDTKNRGGAVLAVPAGAWEAFTGRLKAGAA